MSEVVAAKPREGKFNKNAARRVRFAGKIPAVLYGPGHNPVAVEVDPKQISRILFSETGHNTIFDVEVTGQKAAKAMIVDLQREPMNAPSSTMTGCACGGSRTPPIPTPPAR